MNALDHVASLSAMAAEVARVIAPGGILIGGFNIGEPQRLQKHRRSLKTSFGISCCDVLMLKRPAERLGANSEVTCEQLAMAPHGTRTTRGIDVFAISRRPALPKGSRSPISRFEVSPATYRHERGLAIIHQYAYCAAPTGSHRNILRLIVL